MLTALKKSLALAFICILAGSSLTAAPADVRVVEAAKHKDLTVLRALVRQGLNVNAPEADGATALHWAAHWGNVDMAQLLIRAGGNVNATTDLGVTPLILACETGDA